jgi:hypothetical protein
MVHQIELFCNVANAIDTDTALDSHWSLFSICYVEKRVNDDHNTSSPDGSIASHSAKPRAEAESPLQRQPP